MRSFDLQRLAQRAERGHHRLEVVREALGQRRRLAEAGQVDGYDVAFGRQEVDDRVPGLPVVADAV